MAGSAAARFFPRMGGGEMWSRWDMQDSPPDILITNYSMMNIMLMRSMEMPIFDLTRQWLERDRSRVFHMVVDELHTYRGTPGTEVAYLIRVLLDRLGLSPDSSQLRIIASSASLTGDASGLDYLEAFFGRDREPFSDHRRQHSDSRSGVRADGRNHGVALRDLGQSLRVVARTAAAAAAQTLHAAVGAPPVSAGASPEQILYTSLEHIQAADGLRIACTRRAGGHSTPRFPVYIGNQLFPALTPPDREAAVDGLVGAVCKPAVPKIQHYYPCARICSSETSKACGFVRNPSAVLLRPGTSPCPVGQLHYTPALTCGCGSRIVELLYCEACGEVFLGGYRSAGVQS